MRTRRPAAPGTAPLREVRFERLAAGGDAVGRLGGKVVFTPLAAPGDLALVEIAEERRSWCRGRLARLLEPSPERVAPTCPAFGVCGGCAWQHVAYPAQLAAKRAIVDDALRRIGRLEAPPAADTLPSPRVLGYRHRARLHAARGAGGAGFGFLRRASHEAVALERCPVLHPGLEPLLAALAAAARRHPDFFARCADARADTDYEGRTVRLALRRSDGTALAPPPEVAAFLRSRWGEGAELLLGPDPGRPLALGPGALAPMTTGETFTQVNLEQNLALVGIAMDLAAPADGEEVLDLCCGLGNLALPAAARGAAVLGVDLDPEAVRQGEENARRLGLAAAFRRDAAEHAVRDLAAAGRRFGLVMLNPPRTGAREAAAAIPALGASRVLLVSCDPATLARDAALLAAGGYLPAAVRPVDLFPQTPHVETVALLRRAR
jgi:23S rRNA (uracil1939-C5)-methyltransferase